MIIDTHAHLDMLDDPKRAIEEAFEAGVEKIIIPGVEDETFDKDKKPYSIKFVREDMN